MARYREVQPDQSRFMVINLEELLTEDHPARLMLQIVRKLDLSAFDANYLNDTERGGRSAFPADRMLALIFYSILNGCISMREVDRLMVLRADFMYLSAGNQVDHSTFSKFRARHREEIMRLLAETVFLGVESEMIDFGTVSTDGSTIKANANRRDIGTKEELLRRLKHVEKKCVEAYENWEKLEHEGEACEKKRKELERKTAKLETIREKLRGGVEALESGSKGERTHLTDPDADWQKNKNGGLFVGYNAQISVDCKSGMVVQAQVGRKQGDSTYTVDMVEGVERMKNEAMPDKKDGTNHVLDAGYASEANLKALDSYDLYMPDAEQARDFGGKTKPEDREKEERLAFKYNADDNSYTCPEGQRLGYWGRQKLNGGLYLEYRTQKCGGCPLRDKCVGPDRSRMQVRVRESYFPNMPDKFMGVYRGKNRQRKSFSLPGPLTMKMREKLKTPEGRDIYSLRFASAEGVYGLVKYCRNGWEFLRRTLVRVEVEWHERCIAHNLGKLIGFRRVNEPSGTQRA